MTESFYSWQGDTLQLRVYVQPRASRDEIVGCHGDYLKVRISAPPTEGKANTHLIKFLAREFGVGHDQIEITRGQKGRHKQLRIHEPAYLAAGISH